MSNDDLERLKAKLGEAVGDLGVLPEDLEIHLSPKLKAKVEGEEAQRLLTRWQAGVKYLDEVDRDRPQAVLRVCAATQAFLEAKLLDAGREDARALIGCDVGDEPFLEFTPTEKSRLAKAHEWKPAQRVLRIAGPVVASHIASMLGTSDAAGHWLWKEQCKLFIEWERERFECLFSGLDINPTGNLKVSVGLIVDDDLIDDD